MMYRLSLLVLFAAATAASPAGKHCKCVPSDPCWPSAGDWARLNATVAGRLIKNEPVAVSCYPGPRQDARTCAAVSAAYPNATFLADQPLGYDYPQTAACPPANASTGAPPPGGACTVGPNPLYTVNATTPAELAAGIRFAEKHNIRLVVRNTGHDVLGRSTGADSLQVWTRYIRTGITYQPTYKPSDGCAKSSWTGAAFVIGGGYTWTDVYPEAFRRDLVVVGGGTPSVGCLGGWMQGGGHGPATRDYGLGADQVLEARVVLANGALVTASACAHRDLFFALRGGGGGTYGVVVETTVKAWPSRNATVQALAITPLQPGADGSAALRGALADVYAAVPGLADAGFSGYGAWSIASPAPLFGNSTVGYTHAVAAFGVSLATAQAAAAPLLARLRARNGTSLFVSSTWTELPSFAAYYRAFSGVSPPVGTGGGVLASRLLDRPALTGDAAALRRMIDTVAGEPAEKTTVNVLFPGGGQVARDAADPNSGVLPAWRSAYVHNIVARSYAENDTAAGAAVTRDLTFNKLAAMKKLAPGTGSYMNEGDRYDPDYIEAFYGPHFPRFSAIKDKYDPHAVFYCPSCVGSERWREESDGRLCRA